MGERELKVIAAAFVVFCCFAGGVVVYILRIDAKANVETVKDTSTVTDAGPPPSSAPAVERQTIEKFGRIWQFEGALLPKDWGDAAVICKGLPTAAEWVDVSDSSSRLVVLAPPPDGQDGSPSSQWQKVVFKQTLQANQWRKDGFEHFTYRDGSMSHTETTLGVPHGVEKWWAPNGQLIKITNYVNGKRQGESKGWYRDGSPKYIAEYENDKEVSGTYWREDGTKVEASVASSKPQIALKELKRGSIGNQIRTFDFQITNNTGFTLQNIELQIVCKSFKDIYLGSTKLRLDKLDVQESEIVKAMVEADVEKHGFTDITVIGEHKGLIEIEFVP